MGLKSISTLIASVLLVGFTIASGVLVYYFTTTLPKVHTEKASGLSQEVIACAGGLFDIRYYNDLGLYRKAITIDNTLNPNNLTDYQVFINNPVFNESNLVLSFHFSEGSGNVTKDSSVYGNNGELRGGVGGNADSGTNETCLVESTYQLPTCNPIREGQLIGYYIKVGSEIRTINYHKCIGGGHMVCWQNPIPGFTSGMGYEIYNEGDGTNGRGPRWVDGKFGKALSFDGVDDVVYFSPIYATGNLTNFTIIAWIKNKAPSNFCWNFIVGSPWGDNHLMVCGDKLTYLGGNTWVRGQTYINDNKWHLVAVVHNTSNDVRLYVDGRFDNNFPTNLSGAPYAPLGIIGRTFDGLIDEVRIYMRALSEEEIKALYKAKFRYDYGDIRFTDSDGATQLNYYQAGENEFWVKVPFIQANSTKTIYVYYGNPSVTSQSSATNTFTRIIDGVVTSWNFNEGSGTLAIDSSGNNNNGKLVNSPAWVDGYFRKGLRFNGINNYVISTYPNMPSGSAPRTMEAWIKVNGFSGGDGTWQVPVSTGSCNWDQLFEILIHKGGTIHWHTWGTSPSFETINANQWYHVVLTYNGSAIKAYLNGVLKSVTLKSINTTQTALIVGGSCGGTYRNFNGTVDEVRIYNRALSDEEVLYLYNYYSNITTNYSEPTVSISSEENITISLLSSGNPSASMGSQFKAAIYLKNGTKIKKDFSLENNCNLGKDCVLGKTMINLDLNVPIDKIEVCSKACSLICSEFKPS